MSLIFYGAHITYFKSFLIFLLLLLLLLFLFAATIMEGSKLKSKTVVEDAAEELPKEKFGNGALFLLYKVTPFHDNDMP